jgi:DNA-binding NarL/FixJ family response regulator
MMFVSNEQNNLACDASTWSNWFNSISSSIWWHSRQEEEISTQSIIRILVVDDFASWRGAISRIARLEPGWHVVSEASDGLEAVQKAEELKPDLILLDISLPKLTGIEAAEQIRKVAPNSKILFVSSHSSWEIAERALNTGASGYVVKEDAGNELAKAVEAVFQGERYISSKLKGCTAADPENMQASDRIGRTEGLAWPSAPALLRTTEIIHRHEAQFYSHDAVYLESVTHFIGAALNSGNAAIVIATKPHRDHLLQSLKAQGVDVDAAIQEGAYVSFDAAEALCTFTVNGWPDADRFFDAFRNLIYSVSNAAKAEHPRVAICGEAVALLWAEGKREAAIRLEQLGNILAETRTVDILCAFPFGLLIQEEEDAFRTICAEHSAVYSA